MHLKSLELVGFKSFAGRTALEFEPGMTAVVGPNGCGKSNIADAIRWVLGEQSAKLLRGAKMEDCIFNGTDERKPLGMAEVSLTLAGCDGVLDVEYDEVTVSRRVFRSGEGQYLINKTPCRLRDIQRLFLGTGIGTAAYSLMEQGKIDQILSSHPEDRRAIFEEASGITKFKADKKEAIRKLEHTESNLLRLADVVREVRSQIISLQRQAGKARRYKALQEQLRAYDVFAARRRDAALDAEQAALDRKLAEQTSSLATATKSLHEVQAQNAALRAALSETERAMSHTMEASVRALTKLDRAKTTIQTNNERILELRRVSDRDATEIDSATENIEKHRTALQTLQAQLETARRELASAEKELASQTEQLSTQESRIEQARQRTQQLREEAMELESRDSQLQNELLRLDARERSTVVRREHLMAEQTQLEHVVEDYEKRQRQMERMRQKIDEEVAQRRETVKSLSNQDAVRSEKAAQLRQATARLQEQSAAKKAQIEMLREDQSLTESLPRGARALLAAAAGEPAGAALEIAPRAVLGMLCDLVEVEPADRLAFEASARSWLDAVVIADRDMARALLRQLQDAKAGTVRLLPADAGPPPAQPVPAAGIPLRTLVSGPARLEPLLDWLLHGVYVVDTPDDFPDPPTPGLSFVTRTGMLVRGDGALELWRPQSRRSVPGGRRQLLEQWEAELAALARENESVRSQLARSNATGEEAAAALREAQAALDERRHALDVQVGKAEVIAREAEQARDRRETVGWELQNLNQQDNAGDQQRGTIVRERETVQERRDAIRSETDTLNHEIRTLEKARADLFGQVLRYKGSFAEHQQRVEHLAGQQAPLDARVRELELFVKDRSAGLASYQTTIGTLEKQAREAEAQLAELETESQQHTAELKNIRENRKLQTAQLAESDEQLAQQRDALDRLRTGKSELDVQTAELRMRRQNLRERLAADYHITPEQMDEIPAPDWGDQGEPDLATLTANVAEMRAKLESMGPVNLVAIEEYQEREERYAFLTKQQDDLVKAKDQLMDMIKKINVKTSEMFSETFNKVNENFQAMFKKLFGGGSARLVLADEQDVLESGVDIIARPPGKRLQSVSLLSGGERTLTAVALLFAIYMVRPSPFCVLDELDAALDDSNIDRFVNVLKDFLDQSQFVVITHNRRTIGAAGVIYGVTMEERGVSTTVSLKFSEIATVQDGAGT